MAAVFPPPPPDPYKGLNGLNAAWQRWKDWIGVDLPRQWNAFAGLVSQLGGVLDGGAAPPPPPPPTEPPPLHYSILPALALSNLSTDDQGKAQAFILTWPLAIASGGRVRVDVSKLRYPPLTPELAAAALLQWEGVQRADTMELYPWRQQPYGSGVAIWIPGMPV